MNAVAPPTVALAEPDIEAVVIGSVIATPDALVRIGALDPNWFADPAGRIIAETASRLHREGHRVTPSVLVAALPQEFDTGGTTRAKFVAALAAQAVPSTLLSGPLAALKDRWARRALDGIADRIKGDVALLDANPLATAHEAIAALGDVAVNGGRRPDAGSLGAAFRDLLTSNADPGRRRGATTGLASLDTAWGGYRPGQLYVVGGRPGAGKSAFMCSSLRRSAESGAGVALFSLEMGRDEVAARCASDLLDSTSAPTYGALLRDDYDMEKWGGSIAVAIEHLDGLPFHIDASPRLGMDEIAARARRLKARFEAEGRRLAVIGIDHIDLVRPSDRYSGNRVTEIGEISKAGKALAKELDCCVVELSQLSRAVEQRDDKRPSLADLRWSGDIEQDADVVGFVYRPAYYLAQRPNCDPDVLATARWQFDVLTRKNRNGATGDISLWCSIAHSSVRDS